MKVVNLLAVHKFKKTHKKWVKLLSLSDLKVWYFTELFGDHGINVICDALLPSVFDHEPEVLGKILLVSQKVKSVNWVWFSRVFKLLVGKGAVFGVHRKGHKRLLLEWNVDH